ncbi:HEPN domain-containing protein, partial [Bacillus amyloliquefaciens]|uniref:HEPN domain-containing protein n=6 Tax=Bacillus amyloliquefaciens TaxID=1390 RepID=UPI00164FCD44
LGSDAHRGTVSNTGIKQTFFIYIILITQELNFFVSKILTQIQNFLSGNNKKRDSFIFGLVETRNYLTHYDLTNKTKVFHRAVEKYYASLRMNGLLTFLILKKIGLDEEIILNSMKENRNLNQKFSQAKIILDK